MEARQWSGSHPPETSSAEALGRRLLSDAEGWSFGLPGDSAFWLVLASESLYEEEQSRCRGG